MLSSGCSELGTGSSNSPCSANESISLGLVCSIDRKSPRVALHSVVRRHQRRPTLCCVERKMPSNSLLASGDKVNILKMDHPSGDTMREARRGGLGTSARYRFSSENRNSSCRIDCSSASSVRRCSSGHDSIRANPPSSKCELNSLSGSANSSAECFCAVARVAEALRHSAPLKKSSHDLSLHQRPARAQTPLQGRVAASE